MTVSAGVGGGTLGGVLVGGAVTGGGGSVVAGNTSVGGAITALPASLPFTGATHLMIMVAVALVLLVAGFLVTGLARRASDGAAAAAPS